MNYFIMALIALAVGALIKPAAKKEDAVAAAAATNSPGVLSKTVIPAKEITLIDIVGTLEQKETIVTPEVVTGGGEVVGSISGNAEAALAGAKTGKVAEGGLELETGKVPYAI